MKQTSIISSTEKRIGKMREGWILILTEEAILEEIQRIYQYGGDK